MNSLRVIRLSFDALGLLLLLSSTASIIAIPRVPRYLLHKLTGKYYPMSFRGTRTIYVSNFIQIGAVFSSEPIQIKLTKLSLINIRDKVSNVMKFRVLIGLNNN